MSARTLNFEKMFGSLSRGNGVVVSRGVSSLEVSVETPNYREGEVTVSDVGNGFISVLANSETSKDSLNVFVGSDVDVASSRSSFKNGVLTISFSKKA